MPHNKPKNCLIISSRPPNHSAGLGQDMMDALKAQGINVDFLTRFKDKEAPEEVIGVRKSPFQFRHPSIYKSFIARAIRKIYRIIKPIRPLYIINNGIEIKYKNEENPTFPIRAVLSKITKKYDLIITLFWQDMINSSTLKAIYDLQKCPILIYSPDMSPMTGGCFYFGKCVNYMTGCGRCPGLNSSNLNDQTRINLHLKSINYQDCNIAFLGNTWMLKCFNTSALSNTCLKYNVGIVLNETDFIPYNHHKRTSIREDFGIKSTDFLIMLRSTRDIRKGNNDIYRSITDLSNEYKGNRRIVVLTVGEDYFENICQNNIKVINQGTVTKKELIDLYNASDIFVSASHDDAGPSMINQSLLCGTPVVSYKTGVALDVIIDGNSGFTVEPGNISQLTQALHDIISMSSLSYDELRSKTREIGVKFNSRSGFAQRIIEIYNEMRV